MIQLCLTIAFNVWFTVHPVSLHVDLPESLEIRCCEINVAQKTLNSDRSEFKFKVSPKLPIKRRKRRSRKGKKTSF